jgi:regulator of protease activity HflC (stomatin/prohibitin superfamily)
MMVGNTSCCERIDAGHAGIKFKLYGTDKGVQDVSLVSGWVWYNPLVERVYEYPTFVKAMECKEITINAQDGGEFILHPSINICIKPDFAAKVFKKYRLPFDEVAKGPIWIELMNACRNEIGKFTTDSIVSNRESLDKAVQKSFTDAIDKEGFSVEQFTTGLGYSETIKHAIEAKNKAVQDALRVENEIKIAQAEAQKKITLAKADAESYAIRSAALTDKVLAQMWIEQWNGEVSKVNGGKTLGTYDLSDFVK